MKNFDLDADLSFGNTETEDISALINSINGLVNTEKGLDEENQVSDIIDMYYVDVDVLREKGYSEAQIAEIQLGMEHDLMIDALVKPYYNWQQMREIRKGLMEHLKVSVYANKYFSASQMHELRLALLNELDVTEYAKLNFSASQMREARRKQMTDIYVSSTGKAEMITEEEEIGLRIRVTGDGMEAYLSWIEVPKEKYVYADIIDVLQRNDVEYGIQEDAVQDFVALRIANKEIRVAKGDNRGIAADGKYIFNFKMALTDQPKELENGCADYSAVRIAELAEKDMLLCEYVPCKQGKKGRTVNGIVLEGRDGKELPELTGVGIRKDENRYYATTRGFIYCDPQASVLNVREVYVMNGSVNRYTGNVMYDGEIVINGDVRDLVEIVASGDIIISGFVESAKLKSGQNVVIKGGINGGGNGKIEAGGKVVASFFEMANIRALGSVEGGYLLNCNVMSDDKIIAKGTNAKIIGGRYSAALGIEAATIGSPAISKTEIDVGNTSEFEKRINNINSKTEGIDNEIAQLREGADKLTELFGEDMVAENDMYKKTMAAIVTKEKQKLSLANERARLEEIKAKTLFATVKATDTLQANVKMAINGRVRKFEEPVKGAVVNSKNIAIIGRSPEEIAAATVQPKKK